MAKMIVGVVAVFISVVGVQVTVIVSELVAVATVT